jgi:hypothetical protein
MPYKTALRGRVKLGDAEFDVEADSPHGDEVTLVGRNGGAVSLKDALSNLLKQTGFSLQLPGDFPHLGFERSALQLTVSSDGVSLNGTSSAEWKDPFGALKGLTLQNFQLEYSSADRTLSFDVDAEYASLQCKGHLLFEDGKLRVAVVSLPDVALGTILARSVGVDWGPLNALTLEGRDKARPVRLYYCDGPAYSDYGEGFQVDQVAAEIAGHRAEMSLAVARGNASLTGNFDSVIDLKFVTISAPDFSERGPGISVDDKEKALMLDGGVTFLGERLWAATIAARPPTASGYELRGEVHSQVEIPAFKKLQFTFSWSRANGLHIENWRIADFACDLRFPDLLNELPTGTSGGAFASEMFKQSIQTRFDLRTEVVSGSGHVLGFTMSGDYRILVDNDEILSVPLPSPLRVVLKPDQFNFPALAHGIKQAIADAATSLVEQVVDPQFPERSAKFFGAVLAQQFANEATQLIRRRGWRAPAHAPLPVRGPEPEPGRRPSPSLLPPEHYAAELKRTGVTGQQAAGLIAQAYPTLGPADLMELFRRHFPETTGTPFLMLWALGQAGVARDSAANSFLALVPDVDGPSFAAALRIAYPHPGVEDVVKSLQGPHTPGSQAVRQIKASFPLFSATQIGYLLLTYFAQAVPDARAMGTALRAVVADEGELRVAMNNLFPLLSLDEVEAVLQSVYREAPLMPRGISPPTTPP